MILLNNLKNLITRMKKKMFTRYLFFISFFALSSLFFVACKDDYDYNDKEPDWLGASIYDYLESNGNFTYFLRIIDSVEDNGGKYSEVLKKTGSKTVFAAKDDAFEAFFANNDLGIRSYEDLTDSQRRSILFASILDDTYLLEMLSSISGEPPVKGQAMRKTASLSVLDSIPFEKGDQLPPNKYWNRFKDNGIHVLKNSSRWTMVYFLEAQMKSRGITDDDFYRITNIRREAGDAYIFDIKVIEQDITCKNGYINVLEKVLFPADNLAEYIRKNNDTQTFSKFLERYTAPYYDRQNTLNYRALYPNFTDSIFEKRYFNSQNLKQGEYYLAPNGDIIDGLLNFDPGNNGYVSTTSSQAVQIDMAAMFIPSDKALSDYFNGEEGKFLKERYGSWDNIPNNVLNLFINNHMKPSFTASIPSRFSSLEDKMGTPMGIEPDDIDYAKICSNGLAYIMKKVYPPTEYSSVMAPVIFSEDTKVFNWAISSEGLQFDLYLLSMENEFSFLVPTDEALSNYINPVSIIDGRTGVKERWKFFYNTNTSLINAIVYDANTGDSIQTINSQSLIKNHLQDIVDNHIIVGNIKDGKRFYQTKGGATVKVDANKNIIQGGKNIEYNEQPSVRTTYPMSNGHTYFMNNTVQTPLNSVYEVMESNPDFSEFFNLCISVKAIETSAPRKTYAGSIFANDKSMIGTTLNVAFFNTFNYTVYIPTNEAVRKAINDGVIKRWEDIENLPTEEEQAVEAQKLYDFLRYHFQDNSVYISGESVNKVFDTAAKNPATNKFRRLTVSGNGSNLKLTTENGGTANVITSKESSHNVMARDYKFNNAHPQQATQITTSSFAVIHQIDAVLNFD